MSPLAIVSYREIQKLVRPGGEVAWIAGVLLTASRPGRRLRNMLERLQAGQQFAAQSFKMPYECFLLDGICVRMEILDAPVDCRIEDFRYVAELPPVRSPQPMLD